MKTMFESYQRFHFLLMLLLYYAFATCFLMFSASVAGYVICGRHQIQALTQFKNEFDTRGCNHSNSLNGVWCDDSTGVVTKLRLRACLSGTLNRNSSLFEFRHLTYLDLSHNNFTFSLLHSEFGKLNKLEVLSLSLNGFLGQVPSSLSNLSMLSHLDLSHNELTGSFSLSRNLTKLKYLDLSYNHLSGTINPNSSLFEFHHLTILDLSQNNFSSSLPSEFGNLNKLEELSLSSNGFSGQVPPTISNLTLLTKLYLDTNELTGSFPLVQNLTKLSILELAINHFSGTIPPSLFIMPFLTFIDIRRNHFKGSIEVPVSFTPSKLKVLRLGYNHFDETILVPISKFIILKELDISFLNISDPIDLSLLSSLKYLLNLDLSGNSISWSSLSSDSYIPLTLEKLSLTQCGISEFPNILRKLENLKALKISDNRINGKIPYWLWSLPRLSGVDIGNNCFKSLEGSMVNSSVLFLDLGSNCFEGALPHLPLSIKFFSASYNSFSGDIPLSICNRSSLVWLDLRYNNFTGLIPPCLSNLVVLNLERNNLEGNIPDKFYADSPLQTLNIGYNQLTGKLPRSLVNCSSLKFLSVDKNKIEDTFPFSLKALPNLQVLILRSNKFYGSISPPNQGPLAFPELKIFEISDNKFTGSLPPSYFVNWKASSLNGGLYMVYEDISYGAIHYDYTNAIDFHYKGLSMQQSKLLTSYATIDCSGNRLEGEIPESIGLLKALIALNLSNNAFTGHIPLSLANLTELESLDLSRNQLSRTIPKGIGSLSFLSYINLSHNQLMGEIPQGTQIISQPKSSFEGNAGLCGLPLEESCFGTNFPPKQQQPKEQDKEEEEEEQVLNWKGVAIAYGPGVLLGLVIGQYIVLQKPMWLVKIIETFEFISFCSCILNLHMMLCTIYLIYFISKFQQLKYLSKENIPLILSDQIAFAS